jgi:hypothetical protein
MNENNLLVLGPDTGFSKDREKRRDAGPGGKEPEISGGAKTIEGEKPMVLFLNKNAITNPESRELARELPLGDDNGVEL